MQKHHSPCYKENWYGEARKEDGGSSIKGIRMVA